MKIIKRTVTGAVWTLFVAYTLLMVLLHIPCIQNFIGTEVASALCNTLGTKVTVGRVDLGFLNRLIIDDVTIYDKADKAMIRASRLSANIDYYPLTRGKISVSSAQLFGLKGIFYKKDSVTAANYQFVIDSLSSKDNSPKKALNLRINSLVIRHAAIKYDRYDIPKTPQRFNAAHIDIKDISAHVILPVITDDNINITLKKLSFKEASGLDVRNVSFAAHADKHHAYVKDLNIKLPQSSVDIDSVGATYKYTGDSPELASARFSGSIERSFVTPCDLTCFIPQAKAFIQKVYLDASFSGTGRHLNVSRLGLRSADGNTALSASGFIDYSSKGRKSFRADISDMRIDGGTIKALAGNGNTGNGAAGIAEKLGRICFKGFIKGKEKQLSAAGTVGTDAGNASFEAGIDERKFHAKVIAEDINLERILEDGSFGKLSADMAISGTTGNGIETVGATGTISALDYNRYRYGNITLDGKYGKGMVEGRIAMNDVNGTVDIQGSIDIKDKRHPADITATIRNLSPAALNITERWHDARFSTDISAQTYGTGIDDITGKLSLSGFLMAGNGSIYRMERLDITAEENAMHMRSDFGSIDIDGKVRYTELAQSLTNIIGDKLPTLPDLPQMKGTSGNNFSLRADITDTRLLDAVFGVPLEIQSPVSISADMDDRDKSINIRSRAGRFLYDGRMFKDFSLDISTSGDTLSANASIKKVMDNGKDMAMNVTAAAADNKLSTSAGIQLNQKRPVTGVINAETEFFRTEGGNPAAHIHVRPSHIMINDTAWNVLPSDVVYSKNHIIFDNFAIEHNNQHIRINGLATENAADSVVLDLREVDVSYILNLVNFHSVEFSGLASGRACVRSAFGNPDAEARITVGNFRFQNGRMGTLHAGVTWNKADKQIDIDARATETESAYTVIKGYVSPERNYIDLGMAAHNTNIEFLESFCGSFMDNVSAHANGKVRLYGDLSEINLTGTLVADGKVDITPLNTTYRLENDTIRLMPDNIVFNADTIRDRNGNIGIVTGNLRHKNLTRLTYDLNIDAKNLLCYDFRTYNNSTFYGTVFGTGQCRIKGGHGKTSMDVNLTPEKGSFIEYNAASPDAITNRHFITWNDRSATNGTDTLAAEGQKDMDKTEREEIEYTSDMYINFLFNTTDDFTLRVLMDQASGDHIALNGSGSIHASYYNKGAFNMFGNYNINNGIYKLTMQNIIKKDFIFQPGSSIVFGGDPYHAALNLKAVYTINGVSLSDLQIGKSFSGNNIRVDCIMNIGGTPQAPHVDFDIDLPTVNSDAKQMVRSLINSEEEMNQQVIYLLGIGRFYTQNTNNAGEDDTQPSQTSLAMQSLLSGTISQQINSLLSSFVNTGNWNFGANISTGNEGFNNAEYEGLLTGRLLNNRLIINGQFGYRDNANATTSFIGDFDIRYLLYPNGNLAIKVYNQTNDRYFTKSSLNTQGIGIIMKKDFGSWKELFKIRKR